jgi:hypothetical protein
MKPFMLFWVVIGCNALVVVVVTFLSVENSLTRSNQSTVDSQ